MKWSLDIHIPKPQRLIQHRDGLLLIGSCFTDNIGKMLEELKFNVAYNPTGILFDPHSVCRHLNDFVEQRVYTQDDLVEHNGVFHSWNHHTKFSSPHVSEVLAQLNDAVATGSKSLRNARWCVVTLGSSFAYRLKENKSRVANCNKVPQTAFEKEMMTADETETCLAQTFAAIRSINPDLEFILTVSPVRHSRDGLVENNRSKGRLIEAVQRLVETNAFVHYFPAYELVIDVLRDYRFYDIDLVHPNYAATQFVFEKFCATWLAEETSDLVEEIKSIVNAYHHKPQHANTNAHYDFLRKQFQKTKALAEKTPWCNWNSELSYFEKV